MDFMDDLCQFLILQLTANSTDWKNRETGRFGTALAIMVLTDMGGPLTALCMIPIGGFRETGSINLNSR